MDGVMIIEVDPQGNVTLDLKGFEEQSPEVAEIFERNLGTVTEKKWSPKAHAHTGTKAHLHQY
jgi:hypothetical protein